MKKKWVVFLGGCLLGMASPLRAVKLVPVISGLDAPVDVVVAPGEPHRLYVVEQAGQIRVVEKGKILPQPFLTIKERVKYGGEMGLLSLAFHPEYAKNKRYFVNYTTTQPKTSTATSGMKPKLPAATAEATSKLRTVISEFRTGQSDEREVLTFEQPFSNHNGGQLAFDQMGHLYIGTGDGGSAGDPLKAGQDPTTLLGKILRIDVDTSQAPYGIPKDNPFYKIEEKGAEGRTPQKTNKNDITKDSKRTERPEIYAMGLRNPWRFSFDTKTRTLFAADVGQDEWEEINIVERGGNYGWNYREGAHCYEPRENCRTDGLTDPIHEYDHSQGLSITGGVVYRGKKIPELEGQYLYADYVNGRIWALRWDESQKKKVANTLLLDTRHLISSFGLDADQEILVVDHRGAIYRLAP